MLFKVSWPSRLAGSLIAVSISASTTSRAEAQSWFETLFGGFSKPVATRKAVPETRTQRPRVLTFQPSGGREDFSQFQSHRRDDDGYARDPAYGGSYKTVCVRMCDGYYWPMSASASGQRINDDAKRCEASCLGEAKLFYLPKASSDMRAMVDLRGTSYGSLKTAYRYRLGLIAGCGCKAAPWSMPEVARHDGYAAKDAEKVALQDKAIREATEPDEISGLIAAAELQPAGELQNVAALSAAESGSSAMSLADAASEFAHMMPGPAGSAIDLSENSQPAGEVTVSAADLEEALTEVAVWTFDDQPSASAIAARKSQQAARKHSARRLAPIRTAALKSKSLSTSGSGFGGFMSSFSSNYVWPGDSAQRRR